MEIGCLWMELVQMIRVGPKSRVSLEEGHEKRDRRRKEDQMKTEVELGVVCLQGKEPQGLMATTRN